jgi:NAD(P)-dependent dehydrogenase (short-subunit alcohol dehydrogenase family)
MADLKNKITLVTGAAGAIGRAVLDAIKAAGGIGIATDLKGGDGIDVLDVAAEADWQRVVAEIERKHGRLDGLVNAAGIVALGTIEQLDFVAWRRVLSVNLDGTFLGCKYSMPLLRKQGGSIVNLSSVSGLVGGTISPPTMPPRAGCRCSRNRSRSMARGSRRRFAAAPCARPLWMGRWWTPSCKARAIPIRRGRNCRAIFRLAVSASRRRSLIFAFIFCRTRPPSSPARICRSMAG